MKNKKFSVYFYKKRNKESHVEQFIDSLSVKEQQKILAHIKLLEKYGNILRRPYSAYIRDNIFELRIPYSKNQYRILYFFYYERNIILTNGFNKKCSPDS